MLLLPKYYQYYIQEQEAKNIKNKAQGTIFMLEIRCMEDIQKAETFRDTASTVVRLKA